MGVGPDRKPGGRTRTDQIASPTKAGADPGKRTMAQAEMSPAGPRSDVGPNADAWAAPPAAAFESAEPIEASPSLDFFAAAAPPDDHGSSSMILRDALPGAATPPQVPAPVTAALDGESGVPLEGAGARVVTGPAAAAAAHSIDARAFTLGDRIFFGEGQYAPGTAAGDHLLGHELTHVEQQRGAAMPSHDQLAIAPPDHPLEREAESGGVASAGLAQIHRAMSDGTMNAEEYFQTRLTGMWAGTWSGVIAAQVELGVAGTGSPFLSWSDTGVRFGGLIDKVMAQVKASGPDWVFVASVLGEDLRELINRGRGVDEYGFGKPDGDRFVIEELSRSLIRSVNASLSRVASRMVWEWNRTLVAAQKAQPFDPFPAAFPPSPANILPSHPMDRLVINALCDHSVVFDWGHYRDTHPSEQGDAAPRTIRPGTVDLDFDQGGGSWQTLIVIHPTDATAEEIAHSLYGDEAYAHLLTGGGTRWAFRFPPTKSLMQPYDDLWRQRVIEGGGRPLDIIQGFNNIRDPQRDLIESGDDVAILGASSKLPPTGADRAAIAQRMDVMLSITTSMETKAVTFGLGGALATIQQRLTDRKTRVAADDAEASKWDGQSKEQLAILSACANGFDQAWLSATQTYGACDAQGQTVGVGDVSQYLGKPMNDLGAAFLSAAQVSELPDAGRERLAIAQNKMTQLPADVMQATLLYVHELMRNLADPSGYGFIAAGNGAKAGFDGNDLAMEEIGLSALVRSLRDALVNDPKRASELIADMQKRLQLLVLKTTTGVGLRMFDEMVEGLGQVFKGDKLFDKKERIDKVQRRWVEMAGAIKRLDANDPKAVDEIKQKLSDLQKDTDFQALINYVVGEIEDEQTKKKWIAIGVLIGIVIVSALTAGAAAEAAGPGAIGLAAEAFAGGATFTVLSQIAFKDHFDLKDFFFDLGTNVLMFGGLGAIGRVFQVAGEGAKLTMGARLLKFTLENIVLDATMTAQAEYNSVRATGKDLSASEVGNILLLNLVLSAGVSVATRIGGSVLSKFKDVRRLAALDKANADQAKTLALVEQAKAAAATKDVAAAREAGKVMLAADRGAIESEQEALEAIGKAAEKGEIKLSAEDKAAIDTARADNVEIAKQREVGEIMMKLEQQGPNDFIAPPEEYDALKAKHTQLDPEHPPVEAPDGSKMTITPKPVDGMPSEPITVHKQAGDPGTTSAPPDKTPPPKTDNEALALRDWKRLLEDKPNIAKKMTHDDFVARYREGEFFNFETGRWRSRRVQADADWKRLQRERPNWSGVKYDAFVEKYIDGDFWNFETGAWRSRLGRDAPDPVYFAAGVEPTEALQTLFKGAEGQELSFKAYYDMLVNKVKVPPEQIEAAIDGMAPGEGRPAPDGTPRGKSVDDIRHDLKIKYRDTVLGYILDRQGLEAEHPDPRWQGTAEEQAAVRAEASHKRMLDVTKGLNEKDASRISELWYDRAQLGEIKGVISQPTIKGDPAIPTADRQPDNLIPLDSGPPADPNAPKRVMSQDVKLGSEPIDRAQLDDALKWIRKPGGTKVKVKGQDVVIVRHQVSFLRPEGAQAHATEMADAIKGNPNLQVEIFNVRGQSQVVTIANVELLFEPGLSQWLGIPPLP